jgi:ABC-type branched-subunit amino acid transport system substrate-binding protein
MNKKIIFGVVALIVIVIVILNLFQDPWMLKRVQHDENGKPIIKIGLSVPMSGDLAFLGEAQKNAVEMFMDNFNADDAYYKYEIIIEDNRGNVANTVSSIHKMIASDKVNVVLTYMSSHGLAVSPIADRSEVIHFSISTDPNVAQGDYNFTLMTAPLSHIRLLIDYAENEMKVQNISVVMSSNVAVAAVYLQTLQAEIANRPGMRITGVHGVNSGERNFRPILQKITAERPDAIMNLLFIPELEIFLRQYHQTGTKTPMISSEMFASVKDKTLIEGSVYSDNAPATDEFIKEYTDRFGSSATSYAEYTYAMLQILTRAFEAYARPEVKNADILPLIIKKSDGAETSVGKVTAYPGGVLDTPAVLRIVRDGRAEILADFE